MYTATAAVATAPMAVLIPERNSRAVGVAVGAEYVVAVPSNFSKDSAVAVRETVLPLARANVVSDGKTPTYIYGLPTKSVVSSWSRLMNGLITPGMLISP